MNNIVNKLKNYKNMNNLNIITLEMYIYSYMVNSY